ncbi:retrovirus-related pol polyprotein from transposon TNT 1-94 [Tanacetum coccineum]
MVLMNAKRTLVEAAHAQCLSFKISRIFFGPEAIAIACFTQNRSIVHTWYNKTPYELFRGIKPNVQYFHMFGSLCYPTNDRDDLGKMKPKADIRIFIGYSNLFEVTNNSAANTLEVEDTPSPSSIIVEDSDAPQIINVWELVPLPEVRYAIKVKWIWKNKTDTENTVIQNKSHLVEKGYSQQEGIDFEESFALCRD